MAKTFSELLKELDQHRSNGLTYEAIGKIYQVNRATIWKIINTRKPPTYPRIRKSLDLPTTREVNFLEPLKNADRAIRIDAHSIKICPCGQAFIPNHPKRFKCFICSPYRGKSTL